jgi:subtilisin family serine protease
MTIRRLSLPGLAAGLLLILTLATAGAGRDPGPDVSSKIDVRLMTAAQAGGEVEAIVRLADTADLSGAAALPDKDAKGRYVYDQLRRTATTSQAGLRRLLDERGADYRPYWVTNMIWVRGDWALLQELARRPEVVAIEGNRASQLDLPADLVTTRAASAPNDTLWNLIMIQAPEVWAMGYEGQTVVIGGQDTGYDWTHPALQGQYRGWDGQTADHDYNWHDAIRADNPNSNPGNACGYDRPAPCDDGFHGTHTMGTMVGDDGAGRRVGVAPRAQWIGCRNMEEGWGTPATYTECFEWFIAPYPIGGDPFTDGDPAKAPDVINNSWSCTAAEGCAADTLRDVVEAVRAAGIVTVQSAGNSGPQCGSVNTPAAVYEASLTVGAVSSSGVIAGFSSRGPVGGLLKPELVAPGANVESTTPGGGYGLLSGTSMASPHVAGMVALLLSAEPALAGDVDAIIAALTGTAAPQTTTQGCGGDTADAVPNNVYGWGLIDAGAAVAPWLSHAFSIYTPFGVVGP